MTIIVNKERKSFTALLKFIFVGLLVFILGACSAADNLWQGGDVQVKASTQYNKAEIDETKDQQRELRDKIAALEELYIDLMKEVRIQNERVERMNELLDRQTKQTLDASKLNKAAADIESNNKRIRDVQNRLAKMEMFIGKGGSAIQSATPAAQQAVSNSGKFAAHIGSYRSNAEVVTAWNDLKSKYSAELSTLQAIQSTETVPGLGDFIYLKTGPFATRAEANNLCETLKGKGLPKCTVTEFKGNLL